MVVGFSGSIELGFRMVEEVANHVAAVGGDPGTDLSGWLSEWARAVVPRYAPDASGRGVHLLVLATSPSTPFGPPQVPLGMSLSHGSIVRTPDLGEDLFEIESIPFMKAGAVGSGSGVDAYMKVLSNVATMETLVQLVNMYRALPGTGPAVIVAHHLGAVLKTNIEPSVGEDLHLCIVDGHGVLFQTNEEMTGRAMGPIATTWPEVQSFAAEEGAAASLLVG
jgi:hypothetical protein